MSYTVLNYALLRAPVNVARELQLSLEAAEGCRMEQESAKKFYLTK
jgi:hypothetical protein